MKKLLVLFVAIMMVGAFAHNVFAWGSKATGQVTAIHADNHNPMVTVQGWTKDGKLWLGLSFKCGRESYWEDRRPIRVKGRFTKTFIMRLCPEGYSHVRACLWEEKDGGLMKGRVSCQDWY